MVGAWLHRGTAARARGIRPGRGCGQRRNRPARCDQVPPREPGSRHRVLGELRSEAERLVSINAPHMVRVFDYVEQPGEGAAIVMELVEGVSLREMLARRGPLG